MKPAAVYLRMSSAKQDTSIPDQRKAIRQYAKDHGYKLVAEYADAAISGDDTERRVEFQRMIADATDGTFKYVLCWDASRFGRFDMIEGAFWIRPLRDAGVTLVTLDRGEVSWNDFAGRIVWSVETEGRHAYLRDLARNSMRGKLSAAQKGIWLAGKPPFGYRLQDKRLAIDEQSAPIVRRIFADYLAGLSLWRLVESLRSSGIKSPTGGNWSPSGLSLMLHNEVYVGRYSWNRTSEARYVHVTDGRCSEVPSKGKRIRHAEDDWVVIEDAHPALIDRDTFEAVQRELLVRKRKTTPGGGNRFLLTGLIFCGQCGAAMHGRQTRGGTIRYQCGAYLRGQHPEPNTVVQAEVVEAIIEGIDQTYCTAKGIAAFHKRVLSRAKEMNARSPDDTAARIEAVDAKLAKARRRLVEVDSDLVGIVQEHIRELQAERKALTSQVSSSPVAVDDIEAAVEAISDAYRRLLETLRSRDASDVQRVMRNCVLSVTVTSRKAMVGKVMRHTMTDPPLVRLVDPSAVFSGMSRPAEQVCALIRGA